MRTKGAAGEKTLTFEITLANGAETGKRLIKEAVTTKPVTEVIAIGTKETEEEPLCHPNYSGCVPIASDVDCADGGGNGPEFVSGPVRVLGDDVYGLDRDGDGTGCE